MLCGQTEGGLAAAGSEQEARPGSRKRSRKRSRKQVPREQEPIFGNARSRKRAGSELPARGTSRIQICFRVAQQHGKARSVQFARIAVLR